MKLLEHVDDAKDVWIVAIGDLLSRPTPMTKKREVYVCIT